MAGSLEPIAEEGESLYADHRPSERVHAPPADDFSGPSTPVTTHDSPPAPHQASYYPTYSHSDADPAAASRSSSSASLGRDAFDEAKALYETGLSISRVNPLAAILHFRQAASVFSEVGLTAKKQKAPGDAKAAFEEAITLFSSIGEAAKTAMAHYQIGLVSTDLLNAADHIKKTGKVVVRWTLAKMPASEPSSSQALLLYIKLGDSAKEAKALYAIADLASRIDKRTAYNYYLQARVIFHRRDDKTSCANCSYQLGKICAGNKAFEPAVHYFEEASSLFHDVEEPVDEAWSLYRLALVMLKSRTEELALDYLAEARKLFAEAPDERAAEGSCLMRMGEILAASNPPMAKALLEEVRARVLSLFLVAAQLTQASTDMRKALEYVDPVKERIGRRSTMWLRKLEGGRARPGGGDEAERKPPEEREEEAVAWWAVGA
ncbi:hypothetical protein JCM5296_003083 [Sporobolomyces johnsonii]